MRHFHVCPRCKEPYGCKARNCEDFVKLCKKHKKTRKRPKGTANILFLKRARRYDKEAKVVDRNLIIKRDGHRCYLCGRIISKLFLTLDHVVPLKKGGKHTESNLRVACRRCNSRKGAK